MFNHGIKSVTYSLGKQKSFNNHTLPNCVFGHGIKSVTYSVEKQKSSNNHSLLDGVFNHGKQRVTRLREENDFHNKQDQESHEMKIFQIALVKLLPTTMTFTL